MNYEQALTRNLKLAYILTSATGTKAGIDDARKYEKEELSNSANYENLGTELPRSLDAISGDLKLLIDYLSKKLQKPVQIPYKR